MFPATINSIPLELDKVINIEYLVEKKTYDFSTNNTYLFIPQKHSESKINEKLNKNRLSLELYSKFNDNWNNNNALKFEVSHINLVKDLVNKLTYQPSIFPTGRQSIQLEYEKVNNDYLEFEIFNNGTCSFFSEIDNMEDEGFINVDEIDTKVVNFYA